MRRTFGAVVTPARFAPGRRGQHRHVSIARRLLVILGVALWGVAAYLLVTGSHYLGGGLVVLGALCFAIALSGGWMEFFDGLTNWLTFGR